MTFSVSVPPTRNFTNRFDWGQLVTTPLDIGSWALLKPAGLQNHAPQLCWVDDDRLACVWMAGGQEGTASMSIYGSVLRRGQSRWSEPRCLSQHTDRSEQNPLLFVTDDGRLHLIHTAQVARDPQDASWRQAGSTFSMQWTARLYHRGCAGWGQRWSTSTELIDEPAFCRHPPAKGANGNWLLPIYKSLEAGGAFGHDHSQVLPLGSDGKPAGPAIAVPASTGRVHGSIVPSADGSKLLQFFRCRLADRVYLSIGTADGQQWTQPDAIALPNNNSSIQALRLGSGLLALVFNRFCLEPDPRQEPAWGTAQWPRTRWPLTIALSPDDGLSWPWMRDIDTGLGFCGPANWHLNGQLAYPTLLEGRPGELHLAYSWGNRTAIRYVCLQERDILGY
jgi:predicted neuraminidase